METFYSLLKAIEENNKINGAKWSDWQDVQHIQDIYGKLGEENKQISELFLKTLIITNGLHIEAYKDAMSVLEYGIVMA